MVLDVPQLMDSMLCSCLPLRLFADVLNDMAMFMEILAPYFPPFYTLIVCTAGVFKVNKQQLQQKNQKSNS